MKKFTLLVLTGLYCAAAFGQQADFWTLVNESSVGRDLFAKNHTAKPIAYKIFQLNEPAFKAAMTSAPSEKTVKANHSSFIVSFPTPDGIIEKFWVVNAPVMAPELAARYPGINSYAGAGIDNPGSTIRFDVSPAGVHAIILSANRSTIYIDQLDDNYYRVVSRKDFPNFHSDFKCLTDDVVNPAIINPNKVEDADDGRLRTYRLALLSGAEFSDFFIPSPLPTHADSIAVVLAAQNSHVTRANAVYERDFGVRMVLVANNDQIIYFDPLTDPLGNPNSPNGNACQAAINARIGSANYDIGHTESKGSDNGNAGCIGCVCTSSKGIGWTVYSNPSLLEYFVIDYLTHEMGHQFGANHTFSFQLEGTGVQVEPGSGVTIMGYAGITGVYDVAPHSIDLYSVKSIEQITNYIKTGNGAACAAITITGNTAPTVSAGPDYTIPISTPFKLTGTASDPDAGDVLTYNWEQIDNRSGAFPSIPVSTATDGPMFRTYLSYTTPTRTFPDLQYILTGLNGFQWEVLPSVGRTMNFRFIAKDNHVGGGNNKTDDMVVTTAAGIGPFLVTAPNTAVSWTSGTTQTVTWSVNGTTGAPVSCANVNILLSTDGGLTFPTVLAANTPNDGTEQITLPCISTTTARIKVESVGNIFFDISDANFSIQPGFSFNSPAPVVSTCPVPATMSVSLGTLTSCSFSNSITLSASGNPPGTTVSFSSNPVTPGTNVTVTLNGTNTLSPGPYIVTITGTASGAVTKTRDLTFVISASTSPSITTQPTGLTGCVGSNATFSVTATNASFYQWQVSIGGGSFTDIAGATSSTYTANSITTGMNGNQYRVVITSNCALSVTSNAVTLTVISPVVIAPSGQPANSEICSGSNTSFAVTGTSTQTIVYQWQVSTDGGATWNNVINTGVYSGATTATLVITGAATSISTYRYRSQLSNATCTAPTTSNTGLLTVRQLPSVGLTASLLTALLPGQTTTLTATPSVSSGGTMTTSWFFNATAITNTGNTRVVDVENVGDYQVTIQELWPGGLVCSNQSAIVSITATPSPKLFIFPSPNDGRFTVSYYNNGGSGTQRKIAIYDSKGGLVYNRQFSITGPYTLIGIDLRTNDTGIYYVVVADANGNKLATGKVHVR